MTRRLARALTLSVLAMAPLAPGTARARLDLSMGPPTLRWDDAPTLRPEDAPRLRFGSGPTLSLGSVGLDPCPSGLCRTPPNSNLFYFMTKGTHPIEPVPGILLRIPLGGSGR